MTRSRITLLLALPLTAALTLTACGPQVTSVKREQARQAQEAANSLVFSGNAEIDNIKRRLELTSKPGQLGYILLYEMGTPLAYYAVKGKVTSGSKRLTSPYQCREGNCDPSAPSDEGTYGSSGEYIFFWTTAGQYVQWNGKYLLSDQPIRTSSPALVMPAKATK